MKCDLRRIKAALHSVDTGDSASDDGNGDLNGSGGGCGCDNTSSSAARASEQGEEASGGCNGGKNGAEKKFDYALEQLTKDNQATAELPPNLVFD